MKKISFYMSAAASMLLAFAMTACTVSEDNPVVGPQPDTRIDSGEALLQAIATAEEGAVIDDFLPGAVIELPEGYTFTKEVSIVGDEETPITIVVPEGGISVATNFSLANVNIDATNNSKALISLATEVIAENLNETDYIGIDNITLSNVNAKGIKGSIIYDNKVKYCVVNLTIENSIFELATEATDNQAFISFQQGGVKDFTMKNSTVYQTGEEENNYFLRYNNSARLDRFGFDKNTETQSISYINNTFYNVGKKGQWGNYNGFAGQKYSEFHVTGNIWVESGNGQVARRILGGRNASSYTTCEFNNNTYWFDGKAEEGNTQYDEGTQLTTDPAFADAENADFTPTGAEQVANQTGDPRWFK